MTTSPKEKIVQTSLRLPSKLHAELLEAAKFNCRPLNGEIVARLLASSLDARLDRLSKDNSELKKLAFEILEAINARK